jgi:hypothetical protein
LHWRTLKTVASLMVVALSLQLNVSPVAAAYVTSCATGGAGALDTNWTTIQRIKSNPAISGVIGEATIRTLRPCTNAGSANWDIPWVLPANLQFDGTPSGKIVQIGYGRCGRPVVDGDCNTDIPNDGDAHFVYTLADNSGGGLRLADGWYGNAPVLGHEYRFKIELASGQWKYCIKDRTTGENYTCHYISASWTSGIFAWYGTETNNTNSQMGVGAGEVALNMRWMEYERSGSWTVVDGLTGCTKVSTDTFPAYYHCSIQSTVDTDGNGLLDDDETLWSHTVDH